MNKSIGGFVVCLLGLVACNVERYDDCDGDSFDYGDDFGGSFSYGGSTPKAGHASTDGGRSSDGGTASSHAGTGNSATAGNTNSNGGTDSGSAGAVDTGQAGTAVVPPKSCAKERDCEPGYNCAADTHECLPAAEETCGELETELACTHRSDCTPIYGGTNCSCGKDCECHGGEPGCVCETFQFFVCQAAE
jgi:hypothetical protein